MIEQLARDKEIKGVAVKYGGEYADDIFQDALIKMMELPTEKMQQLIEDNGQRYYFRQVVYHECMARHRQRTEEELNTHELTYEEEDNSDNERITAIQKELNTLHWYDRDIFTLYVKLGSSRKVQEDTGINYQAVCATVRKVKHELRDRLLHRDF